ncbi:MAG: RNA polymerase sigma-70 factor [Bacteroidales bacterium]|jgi:RNA polymerase sigma-70 factor (ECF subfamily)
MKQFNNLYNQYSERFIRFAEGYVNNRQVAEDFVSEAFTIYWEKKDSLLPNTNPQAYILTIIKNRCLNYLQSLQITQRVKRDLNEQAQWKLKVSIQSLQACDPDFMLSNEIQLIIDATLQNLPEKTREIFILHRFHGVSYKDIARQMRLSNKAVEFHISKALRCLRISLKDFIRF